MHINREIHPESEIDHLLLVLHVSESHIGVPYTHGCYTHNLSFRSCLSLEAGETGFSLEGREEQRLRQWKRTEDQENAGERVRLLSTSCETGDKVNGKLC